jgi:hypothetical protein
VTSCRGAAPMWHRHPLQSYSSQPNRLQLAGPAIYAHEAPVIPNMHSTLTWSRPVTSRLAVQDCRVTHGLSYNTPTWQTPATRQGVTPQHRTAPVASSLARAPCHVAASRGHHGFFGCRIFTQHTASPSTTQMCVAAVACHTHCRLVSNQRQHNGVVHMQIRVCATQLGPAYANTLLLEHNLPCTTA